ncbi:uncharacterized protein [Triticum aestivum]|uniref:uncharacterized protein n=1 Tax=Triticum aestivum TaxID=4565 RepID=UPI001D01FD35|nr:uncharacterized protein LOC123074676 [Triticum aestivum]
MGDPEGIKRRKRSNFHRWLQWPLRRRRPGGRAHAESCAGVVRCERPLAAASVVRQEPWLRIVCVRRLEPRSRPWRRAKKKRRKRRCLVAHTSNVPDIVLPRRPPPIPNPLAPQGRCQGRRGSCGWLLLGIVGSR